MKLKDCQRYLALLNPTYLHDLNHRYVLALEKSRLLEPFEAGDYSLRLS